MEIKDLNYILLSDIESSQDMAINLSIESTDYKTKLEVGGFFYFIDAITKVINPEKVFVGSIEVMFVQDESKNKRQLHPVLRFYKASDFSPCGDSDHGWYARTKEELLGVVEPIRKDMDDDGLFENEE